MAWLDSAALILIGCVGLHVPRAFTLLYVLIALIFGLSRRRAPGVVLEVSEFQRWRLTVLLLLLFSATYCLGMVFWGFWTWQADRLDLINALLLPALLFVAGLQAASLGRMWSTRLLLAYALGALAYPLIALMLAREPWWAWEQVFPGDITVPWGASTVMNVRSVEQNAFPALILLPAALLLLVRPGTRSRQLLALALAGFGLLGAHVVWSLNGRLGWLGLLCAGLPILGLVAVGPGRQAFHWWRRPAAVVVLALGALSAFSKLSSLIGSGKQGLWSQGFCDERLSIFGGMLSRLYEAPWGGRLLRVPYLNCNGAQLLFAVEGGNLSMAHNVVLDVYFNTGLFPSLLLVAALVPPLLLVLKGFMLSWRDWDWQAALRWGWLCLLLCEWLFQPLLYSDGLLFYFSFFLLGLLVVESRSGFNVASAPNAQGGPGKPSHD